MTAEEQQKAVREKAEQEFVVAICGHITSDEACDGCIQYRDDKRCQRAVISTDYLINAIASLGVVIKSDEQYLPRPAWIDGDSFEQMVHHLVEHCFVKVIPVKE